jgi:hypothetical protein
MSTHVTVHRVTQTETCPVTKNGEFGYIRHYRFYSEGRLELEVTVFSDPGDRHQPLKMNYSPCECCKGREEPAGPQAEDN